MILDRLRILIWTSFKIRVKITNHNTDGIIHKLVTVFAVAPAPKTDL